MLTRCLIAGLLMTSACVAHADVLSSSSAPHSKLISYMARPLLMESTPVTGTSAALTPTGAITAAATTGAGTTAVSAAAASVPEPSSIALLAAGMFGVMGLRRRRDR